MILVSLGIFGELEGRKEKVGTLQYDFGKDNGQNILILKTDNLFLPKSLKKLKNKGKLDLQVKKSILLTKKEADRKLKKEIRRRKKIEKQLQKEKEKWRKKMKKKHHRKLMLGGGDKLKQDKELKESMSMFKMLEKSSSNDVGPQ